MHDARLRRGAGAHEAALKEKDGIVAFLKGDGAQSWEGVHEVLLGFPSHIFGMANVGGGVMKLLAIGLARHPDGSARPYQPGSPLPIRTAKLSRFEPG